jgi:acyl carrier protein
MAGVHPGHSFFVTRSAKDHAEIRPSCLGPPSWAQLALIKPRGSRQRERASAMSTLDDVRQIIAKTMKIPLDQLTADTRLDEIGAESLDVIEIVFELEEKFGIDISLKADGTSDGQPPADPGALPFQTVGEIAVAVQGLIDAKAAS